TTALRGSCRGVLPVHDTAAPARHPHSCCLQRVGEPPGLIHIRGNGQLGELHRDERHPRRRGRQHRLIRCRDLHPRRLVPRRVSASMTSITHSGSPLCLSFDWTNRPAFDASKSRTGSNPPAANTPRGNTWPNSTGIGPCNAIEHLYSSTPLDAIGTDAS